MANLTQTAYLTRKIIKYGTFFLVFLIIFRVVWGISVSLFRKVKPPSPPPPTVSFSTLPALKFPEKTGLPEVSFSLETIEGSLPQLDSTGRVYFVPQKSATLFSLEDAKKIAQKMGFSGEPQKLSARKFLFQTGTVPNTTLEIDIVTNYFKLNYDFINDQEILPEKKLPSDTQAVSEAKSFLSQSGLLTPDLGEGTGEVSYLKLEVPNLVSAISLSEADFVQVDLFRRDVNGLKVFPPKATESQVTFLISGSRNKAKRIVRIGYIHTAVDEGLSGTYPLKSVNRAWQELLSQGGYIANLGENPDGKITIRKIYLAYYEQEEPQEFLQPIFVFEGDSDFYAYVPAVDPKWIE